jgi:DNA-binding NarL/FixJ family response regulator
MLKRRPFLTVLIGKHVLIREGIARILNAENFRIMASVSCIDDLPPGKLQPRQLLILIVNTGDDFNAVVEQIEHLRGRHQRARIAIVANHYRLDEMLAALRAGANGYFVEVMTSDVFIKSIELVMMGETILPPAFMSYVLDPERLGKKVIRDDRPILFATEDTIVQQLSPREKSILRHLIEGDSNKSIARKIDIAEATVKVHVKAILRKIGAQNRTQAAIWGMNNEPLARPANDDSASPTVEIGKRLPNSIEMVADIKQIETAGSLERTDHQTPHVELPRIGRLIRKSIARRTNGTRFGK